MTTDDVATAICGFMDEPMLHYGWRKVFTNEFRSAGENWNPPDGDLHWIPVYVRQSDLRKDWQP